MDLTVYLSSEQHFKFILTIVDVASRRFGAVPLRNRSANEIVRALRRALNDDFATRIIDSDDGSEFNNRQAIVFLSKSDIELRFTVPERKNQNAMIVCAQQIDDLRCCATLRRDHIDKQSTNRRGPTEQHRRKELCSPASFSSFSVHALPLGSCN